VTDSERIHLIGELQTRLRALEDLPTFPTAKEVPDVSLHCRGGSMRIKVNAATRPLVEAFLKEEHARLEAIALGVDRKVAP